MGFSYKAEISPCEQYINALEESIPLCVLRVIDTFPLHATVQRSSNECLPHGADLSQLSCCVQK